MLDPAFSGSYTKTLLSPTPNSLFYLPLGNGLSVSTYFGGLQAVLSGSGSATGAALFGVGASANAYLGVGYHDTKNEGVGWSLPAGVSYSVIPPYAYYDDFALNQINVDVELVATQIFEVAYSYALSAEFSVDLTGSANYAYSFASAKTPTMTIAVSSAKNSTSPSAAVVSKSSNGAAVGVPHLALSPGDSVTLSVKYENFNPGERTELFVSVHRDDDISELGVSILQVPFMVNGAGHGSFEVEWEVPWDSKFIGAHKVNGGPSPSRFSVHASNQMSVRFYAEQAIQITADPHVHGMILLPGPEDTIVVNTTYSVVWRSNGLTTFKRTVAGKSGMGHIEPTAFVNIELRFEDLDANGETALAGYVRLNAAPEPNDRSAPVVIPSSVLGGVTPDCTRRFFLVVASANNSNLMGWSRGYLNVVPALTPDAVSETSRRLMAYTGGLHKADGQFRRSPGSRKSMQTVRALPHATPAPLGSCSDSGTVTYTSFVEGSFNSFTVVSTFEFEIEDASASFELLTSQKCVSTPAAVGTEDGPPAVPSSVLSSAGVAGISVVSTLIAVVVIAVLYLRYFAACRGSGSTAKPDASTGNTAGEAVPEVEIDTMSANPLAIAATEV